MKSKILGLAGAVLASLVLAATSRRRPDAGAVHDARPDTGHHPSRARHDTAEVQALRHDGLSLAQIAEKKKVDPQKLVDALAARWTSRIDARVANGALTADEGLRSGPRSRPRQRT